MQFTIRQEKESDFRQVEELTREAFWNLYVPGCNEHYLVHVMRNHPDFIKELDFVAEYDNKIIGNIMYLKSHVIDKNDPKHILDTITFGPLSVLPEFQKKGVGASLVKHSMQKALEMGYRAVIIYGHPHNYCKHGFKNGKDLGISDPEGMYPYGLLVLELEKDVFKDYEWKFFQSDVYDIDPEKVEEFDSGFIPKEKGYQYTQEEFFMACRAYLI